VELRAGMDKWVDGGWLEGLRRAEASSSA